MYITDSQVRRDDFCGLARPGKRTRCNSVDGDPIGKEPFGRRSRLCSSGCSEQGVRSALPFAQHVPLGLAMADDDRGFRGVMLDHEVQGGRVAASVR